MGSDNLRLFAGGTSLTIRVRFLLSFGATTGFFFAATRVAWTFAVRTGVPSVTTDFVVLSLLDRRFESDGTLIG